MTSNLRKKKTADKPNKKQDKDLQQYLIEVGRFPLLTIEEERALFWEIKRTGDKAAKEKAVNHNLRLVIANAKRYVGRGVSFLDLIQEGNMGLMVAIDGFQVERGFKFSTYATWWIKQKMRRAIDYHGTIIRLPAYIAHQRDKLRQTITRLTTDLGRRPNVEEIAQRSGLALSVIKEIVSLSRQAVSLDEPLGNGQDDGEGSKRLDWVEGKNPSLSPFSKAVAKEEIEVCRARIARYLGYIEILPIKYRDRKMFKLYLGIGTKSQQTLKSVSAPEDLTRERGRQIFKTIWAMLNTVTQVSGDSFQDELERLEELRDVIGNPNDVGEITPQQFPQEEVDKLLDRLKSAGFVPPEPEVSSKKQT